MRKATLKERGAHDPKKLGYDDYFKPKIALKVCTENIQPTLNLAKRQKNIRARKARKKLNNAHSNLELL